MFRRQFLTYGAGAAAALAGANSLSDYRKTSRRELDKLKNASDGSGQVPTGDLPGWKQIYAEDFDTDLPVGSFRTTSSGAITSSSAAYAPYAKRFSLYGDTWGPGARQFMYYPSRTLSTSGSALQVHAHSETINGRSTLLSAAFEPTLPQGPLTYGRYHYRLRGSANGSGIGCVLLCWPVNDGSWPRSGEMDFIEGDITQPVQGFHHIAGTNNSQKWIPVNSVKWSDWNEYVIEWLPGSLRYLVNGSVVYSTSTGVPSVPMRFLMQTGADGAGPASSTSGLIEVDWVSIYKPA